MEGKYEFRQIEGTRLYDVFCDGTQVAAAVEMWEAVAIIENAMHCRRAENE